MVQDIISLFDHPFFILWGGLSTCLIVIGLAYKVLSWFLGVTPILIKFGIALRSRKIAVFASNEAYQSLKSTLLDSNIFKENNIVHIQETDTAKAKDQTIYLIDWSSSSENIELIYSLRKNHQTAVIIFAKPASIPHEAMNDIANRSNTVKVNFKGRLLNDVLTSLVTTSYDK